MTGYQGYDAVGLAAAIRSGELDASEVVESAIDRIAQLNPALNAVVHDRFDAARAEVAAGLPAGPLSGVPVLVKPLGADVAGLPTTRGSRLWAEDVKDEDSALVRRYRAAGMVVLGITNTPELGLSADTAPALHGATHNPWRHGFSPGGSSGGSAAAVAAGMVPAAHASDGGGSIRIPAAMCGLVGLKPSRGRVSAAPYASGLANPTTVHHAVTRTVRDSAALLDVVAGIEVGDPYGFDRREGQFTAAAEATPRPLRIGLLTRLSNGPETDPACAAAARHVAEVCARQGHQVQELNPTWDSGAAAAASGTVMGMALVREVDVRTAELGRGLEEDDLEPFTRMLLEHYRSSSAGDAAAALAQFVATGRAVGRLFADVDVLVTPTVATTVPEHGFLDTSRPETLWERGPLLSGWTSPFNVTGMPAVSLPAGRDETGMPLGAQLVAPLGDDALLISLAARIEDVAPWPHRAPDLAASPVS